MNKLLVFITLLILLISCDENPCDNLKNGAYKFPEVPDEHDMNSEEVYDFVDLPKDISECITTEGLLETCLNYPYLSLIYAGYSLQSGYSDLVSENFRGVRELEQRTDRGTCLLNKYLTFDPIGYDINWESAEIGKYKLTFLSFEVIFSQYVNLEALTEDEIIKTVERAINIYDITMDNIERHSILDLYCVTTLLSRIMYIENYESFLEIYDIDDNVWRLTEFYGPVNLETVELVYNLSLDYLEYLKNKNL